MGAAQERTYAFNADPLHPTLIVLEARTPGFAFAAEVRNDEEELIAHFDSRMQIAALALEASGGSYRLMLRPANAQEVGVVLVSIGAAAAARSSPPAAILNKAAPPCQIMAATTASALVRSAPSSDYEVIGTLAAGTLLPILGRTDNGWYAVNYAERQGWLAGDVGTLLGQCDPLQRLNNPAIPIAATDSDVYLIEVDRDGSAQLHEAMSTPLGDTSDLVWIRAINLYTQSPNNYREFALTLNCTGIGADHVRWGSPYEPTLRCGESATVPFLFNLNQQPVAIVFEANSPQSYVEYMLTVSSTTASPGGQQPGQFAGEDAVG